MHAMETMCVRYFNIRPLIVGPGIKTGLNLKVDNPREIGSDRIVNAVAKIRRIRDTGYRSRFWHCDHILLYR